MRCLIIVISSLGLLACGRDRSVELPQPAVARDTSASAGTPAEAAEAGSAGTPQLGSAGVAGASIAAGAGGMAAASDPVQERGGSAAVNDAGSEPTLDAAVPIDAAAQVPTVVETSGSDCMTPPLLSPDQLTPYAKHHDPFMMLNGTRIVKKSEWGCRRAEIRALVEEYESGPKPIVPKESVRASYSDNQLTITVSDGAKSTSFAVTIARPSIAASSPAPLAIQFKFETLDTTVFAENGVATIVFDHDKLGAQSGGSSRGMGAFYELYGRDHPASSMVAWAWGVSRIIDALELTPEAGIDPQRVAVTGCSRYGKGALLAGALDERIVLTIPQESGAGGVSSWRVAQVQSESGENVQTLSSAAGEQPWFRASFGPTFGSRNVAKLPFDHHMVMGLVAPRALLVIDNEIDWGGIDSSFTAGSIAHAIWDALGIPDRMGYWQTSPHAHCEFPASQRAVLDAYVRKFLVGSGDGDTQVLRADRAQADLKYWMEWETPALQ